MHAHLREDRGPAIALAAAIYHLQLDRMRLRTIAARQRRDGNSSELAATMVELEKVEEVLAGTRGSPALPDTALADKLGLSAHEMDFVWAVVAASSDPALSPHLRELFGGDARHGISLALHALIAELDTRTARSLALALTPLHPLLRYNLLEIQGDGVMAARPLAASARLAAYLAGDDRIDDSVLRSGGVVRLDEVPRLDDPQRQAVKRLVHALSARRPAVIVIEGPAGVGKRTAAALAALAHQRAVLQIDASRLDGSADLERGLVSLRRECLLVDRLPLVSHIEELLGSAAGDTGARTLARFLDETPTTVFLTSTTPGVELSTAREIVRIAFPLPSVDTRIAMWRDAFPARETGDLDLASLAVRYRLGAGGIRRAVAAVESASDDASLTSVQLVHGIRCGIADRLGDLAYRVEVKQDWDELVLSRDTLDQITGLVSRVRHAHLVHEEWGFGAKLPRGLGTAALFSGAPGTGKTMVAGLIARELELELYQVDLSKVMSKWVGETEKQLAKIFDAAEAGHALLLFDEADSLFAKRTEVKSANDRFANLEVNYLLQRIECFGGISILTTNLDTSIDPALRRRLASHIVFYPPDVDERIALWRRMLATNAPRDPTIDFEELAEQFPDMTGANIRNSALAAAFLAASESSQITQNHLERAARGEYRAMGRVIH